MNHNVLILSLSLFVFSCSNMSLAPEVVRKSDAQKQQYVTIGTIIDVTNVVIEGDREAGSAAGAVIGAAIGANEAEKNSTTTAMVCKTETRKKSTTVNEYSHSTISFAYDGIMYEVDFIKKQ